MKKQNGFVFMETIIVISVLCVTLLILFSSYSYILRKSRSRNAFDTTETIYKTYLIKNLMDSYAKQYTSTGIGVEYYIQQHLGGTKPECYKSTYGANSSYTCDLSQVDPASWLYQAHVSFEVDKIYYLNPSLILKSSYEKEWLNTFDATTIDYIRSLGKNTNNNILVVKYKKYYNKTNGSYEVLHSSMKITEQNGILVSSKDYVASVHLDYQGNGTGNKTDFNINYGGSNTFEVTPESGYYLSSITCTNGYTVVANTSTTATGKQTITVYNNNVGDSSTCTIEFSGVANAVSIKVANPATGSVDKTNINVGYNSTNHVKVTPVKGYYLDAVTCTNGYTVNAVTGTTASEAQEITIRNPGNSKPSDCTVVFGRKVSNGALQKGDYVILRPDAKKITIDKADTGYDYNQEIDLSKISAWRVLDVYSDGTADLVLNIPSKELIMFKGQTGYRKYIYTLNKIADQYKNSNFTIKARAVGYSNQGETITGDIYKFVPRDIEYYYVKEHKDKIFNVNTIEVQGSVNDSGYKSDILKLKEIEDTQMDYWIASRTFESSLDTHVPLSGIFSGKKADLPAKIDESYLDRKSVV